MRYAIKKRKPVHVYKLGDGGPMEQQLLQEGAIERLPDGHYALFSQESVCCQGEIAEVGDYFKVDTINSRHFPYPNSREYFQKNHIHISGDLYEQIAKPVGIWRIGDDMCGEIQHLLQTGQLLLNEDAPERYFNAELWGAPLSAPKDAVVAIYSVDHDEAGNIAAISFNFIQRLYFEEHYEWME